MLKSWLSANWIMYRKALAFGRLLRLPCSRAVQAAPGFFKKIAAFFVALFQLFGALIFDWPTTPDGPMIDMSRFELVWSDEFDGASLDQNIWSGHYIWQRDGYQRSAGWWDMDHVKVEGGNLVITADYRDTGPSATGFYASGIDTTPGNGQYYGGEGYEQLYGYFETRCILTGKDGMNAAFWLLCEGMFQNNPSGVGGSEIDVFETKTDLTGKEKRYKDSVFHTIHVGGYDNPNHKNQNLGHFYAVNPTQEYNTYGVEWNKNEYIFYINGQETARTTFAGPCQVPMYLIFSLIVDENAKQEQMPAEFVIDYVRAYQYK